MADGTRLYEQARYADAFRRFERAHVLGQRFVIPHTRTHVWMLRIGWKTRSVREILGQLIRIPGGIVGSALGLVPVGNTGGSNVPAMKRLSIPDDLKQYLDAE
jgi:hypothetical protein